MKTVFVEARSKENVVLPDNVIAELPHRIALFTTVQFIGSVGAMKKQLEKGKKEVLLLRPKHSKYKGQLLGCGIERFNEEFDAFLYVGDGVFHPMALMLKNERLVYVFNPYSKQFKRLDKKEVNKIKARVKVAYKKFLSAERVGVIISTKPGQSHFKEALELEKKHPNKKFYFIIFDTVDFNQLDNFTFVDVFVNTACPRIGYDDSIRTEKPIINIEDITSSS